MKIKIKKIKIQPLLAFFLIIAMFLFSGCLKQSSVAYKVDLEIWGPFDSGDVFDRIIGDYKMINPYVREIKYRKFTVDAYKNDLINALATGQGPDIFLINNTWTPSFQDKIEPAPEAIIKEYEFRNTFVDVAVGDFLEKGKIYGIPLSVDSLALYYNKDMFNAAGITSPPKTWEDFNDAVYRLNRVDSYGEFIQSGAALGTAYNINRATDILGLLMFQNGTQMVNQERTEAIFDRPINIGNETVNAGESALKYYTAFAQSNNSLYSWNPRMHYSIDSFYEGKTAMMINYSWHYETIKNKNSKLNFAVAPVPQIDIHNPVNFANYWGFAVSKNKISSADPQQKAAQSKIAYDKNKTRIHESWQFLRYLAMKNGGQITLINGIAGTFKTFPLKSDPADEYLKMTKRPAARRDIIEKQKTDPILNPFAFGNLTAKSWHQKNPEAAEHVLKEMIDSINRGDTTAYEALKLAAVRVSQTMR